MLGLGWMGQAHSRSVLRIPSLFPERSFQPGARRLRRHRRRAGASAARAGLRLPARRRGLAGGGRVRRRRRGVGDGPEHAARPDDRGRLRGRQGGLQREADRRQARADRAGLPRGPGRRRAPPGSATTTCGRRWCCMRASSSRPASSARSPTTAGGSCRCTAATSSACSPGGSCSTRRGYGVTSDILSHSVAMAQFLVGGISEVVGMKETTIKQRPLPTGAASHYGRGRPEDPDGRRRERGLRGDAVPFRGRRHGRVRGQPHDRRPGEPERLRGVRHQGRARVEPREDQRAAVLPRRRRPQHRLHDHLRRRPLPVPRRLRTGPGQRHRLRGPRRDRGPTRSSRRSPRAARSRPGFREAVDVVSVQQALIDSWDSRTWQPVVDLADRSERADERDRAAHDRRGDRPLPHRPADRHRRRRGAAVPRRHRASSATATSPASATR